MNSRSEDQPIADGAAEVQPRTEPEPRRRLVFVVNVAWFFLSHRLEVALAARAAGYEVHLASDCERESEIAQVRACGIYFHRVRIVRGGLNPAAEAVSAWRLRRLLRRLRPDIVHNVTSKAVIYGSAAALALGTPGIVNAISGFGHAYAREPARAVLRSLLDRAFARVLSPSNVRVVVQNQADRAEVVRICPEAADRVRLIAGSGVDLARFRATPEADTIPIVLLPARMLRAKGIYEFAAAATQLRQSGKAARFVLAGRLDPANRGALTAQEIAALCEHSGVEWVGDSQDMPRLLSQSHIVCLPSYYREGVPKALLEACASARAVITTDMPGCRDAVRAGETGLLVPARDSRALAAALAVLLDDASARRRMGLAGRCLAEREFAVERVVQQHLQVYRELLPPDLEANGS